jgi:hypothetical protein
MEDQVPAAENYPAWRANLHETAHELAFLRRSQAVHASFRLT